MIAAVRMASLINLEALLLLAAANSAPVLLSMLLGDRWAASIDGGRHLRDGRPVFGPHKTWRGLLGGTAAAGVTGALLSAGFVTGAAFGLLALIGDLLSSFIKRRLGYQSGRDSPVIDQLPEALLPLLVLHGRMGVGLAAGGGTLGTFILLGVAAAKVFTYRRTPGRSRGS